MCLGLLPALCLGITSSNVRGTMVFRVLPQASCKQNVLNPLSYFSSQFSLVIYNRSHFVVVQIKYSAMKSNFWNCIQEKAVGGMEGIEFSTISNFGFVQNIGKSREGVNSYSILEIKTALFSDMTSICTRFLSSNLQK